MAPEKNQILFGLTGNIIGTQKPRKKEDATEQPRLESLCLSVMLWARKTAPTQPPGAWSRDQLR